MRWLMTMYLIVVLWSCSPIEKEPSYHNECVAGPDGAVHCILVED